MINLEKIIEKNSLRGIGQSFKSLSPQETVIAGKNKNAILNALNLTSYKVGRFSIQNVFVAYDNEQIIYIYVNPKFRNYRKVFKRIIGEIPNDFHIDHILSKNIAVHFSYKYVLICMLPKHINMKHSNIEKIRLKDYHAPEVCYPDNRIYDKILQRNPTARRSFQEINKGYSPQSFPSYGLALNQKGIWNSTFGFNKINKELVLKKIVKDVSEYK